MPKKVESGSGDNSPEYRARLERDKILKALLPPVLGRKKPEVFKKQDSQEMEQARQELAEKEVLEKVLKESGITVTAWFPKEISPIHSEGFATLYSKLQGEKILSNDACIQLMGREAASRHPPKYSLDDLLGHRFILEDHYINEFLDVRHLRFPVTNEHVVRGKKGFLGIGKTPDRVFEVATRETRQVFFDEIVPGGKKEPAVSFSYVLGAKQDYKDAFGRPGKALNVELILPESTAKDFESAIDKNPALIREAVEASTKMFLKDPSDWDKSFRKGTALRPPWEKWDSIYIQKENGPEGYHEECLRKIK